MPEEKLTLSFEESLAELEKIVQEMESRDLPLEEALARYERGVRLSAHCKARLEEAEAKILKLTGEGKVEPLDLEEE
jgi:exodeoxyribonuclease VII small subunit